MASPQQPIKNVQASAATPSFNLGNVQGDILLEGLPKKNETFFFFQITNAKDFCQNLKNVAKEISHSADTKSFRKAIDDKRVNGAAPPIVELAGANIAFSMAGLRKMSGALKGLDLETGDRLFEAGMKAGAAGDTGTLGDPFKPGSTTEPNWEQQFLRSDSIHGILLVAGGDDKQVQNKLNKVKGLFGKDTVKEVVSISGKVRPGALKGHEHFGFDDGVSQPAIQGVDETAPPGQDTIDAGVILCNRGTSSGHPDWMTDGSFLCFRKLQQNVPEWNKFLVDASNQLGTWSGQLGARLIGRWPSGCPVESSPDFDDTNIGKDASKVNNFDFESGNSFRCPVAAHIRKTNPRSDLGPRGPQGVVNQFRILRRGIPYGEELDVNPNGKRGLLFVCYQSALDKGFAFLQRTWANNPDFVQPGTGIDAVLGQTSSAQTINTTGLFPQDPTKPLALSGINRFVEPKGGEYFFSPSMAALRGALSDVK